MSELWLKWLETISSNPIPQKKKKKKKKGMLEIYLEKQQSGHAGGCAGGVVMVLCTSYVSQCCF
jgi:hypothetical protein